MTLTVRLTRFLNQPVVHALQYMLHREDAVRETLSAVCVLAPFGLHAVLRDASQNVHTVHSATP